MEKFSRDLTSFDVEGYELTWEDINIVLGLASDNNINDRILNCFMMNWLKSSMLEGNLTVSDSLTFQMLLLIKKPEDNAKKSRLEGVSEASKESSYFNARFG